MNYYSKKKHRNSTQVTTLLKRNKTSVQYLFLIMKLDNDDRYVLISTKL